MYRVDLDPGVADIAQALLRILFQTADQQASDRRRCCGGQRRPVGFALEDLRDRVRHGLARERDATGEHFEEHAPERPDVGALIDRLAARLLGLM